MQSGCVFVRLIIAIDMNVTDNIRRLLPSTIKILRMSSLQKEQQETVARISRSNHSITGSKYDSRRREFGGNNGLFLKINFQLFFCRRWLSIFLWIRKTFALLMGQRDWVLEWTMLGGGNVPWNENFDVDSNKRNDKGEGKASRG